MNIAQIWLASASELVDMEIPDTGSTAQLDNPSIRSIIFLQLPNLPILPATLNLVFLWYNNFYQKNL